MNYKFPIIVRYHPLNSLPLQKETRRVQKKMVLIHKYGSFEYDTSANLDYSCLFFMLLK